MEIARFDSDAADGLGWQATLEEPVATWQAARLDEVADVVARADEAAREGRWVAVCVSYDAAPAFEAALGPSRHRPDGFPLAWARAFARRTDAPLPAPASGPPLLPLFTPALDAAAFAACVHQAQARIADGDTYQVNLTFPLRAQAPDDLDGWYARLRRAQGAAFAARLDVGRHAVLSLSPELFFARRGDRLITRPMKGTAPRGRWPAEDEAAGRALADSPKARAENVMIVDLLRNDLGRLARPGSVRVPALFTAERYPTLWQLTSTVEADVPAEARLLDVLRALFPCGSVTGAPKIRTMALIDALEPAARGLYTGAIGLLAPGGDCTFSVAIRTLVVDRDAGAVILGVGAGVTADSVAADEYEESLLKGGFATRPPAPAAGDFGLLETMRLEEGVVVRRARHLARLAEAARHFGRPLDADRVTAALDAEAAARPAGQWRLRLVVDAAGTPEAVSTPHAPEAGPWRVALAADAVDERDPFLCHKTTWRGVYERARRARPHVEDVLLWNRRGEVTEGTRGNLVAEIDGVRWTPPRTCGLLAGAFRGELLDRGAIRERVLTRAAVARADRLWLVNSLREWIDVELVR